MDFNSSSIVVIGGGIVGLAVAHAVKREFPKASVTLCEKESTVGRHQSTHNSGVLHCGLYYKPNSLKAQLAVSGIRLMTAYCQEKNIKHEICGKLVVATDKREVDTLKGLQGRGTTNGLKGLRWLTPSEFKEIEPHATGLAALQVPEEGIVDYQGVCDSLLRELLSAGGEFKSNTEVKGIKEINSSWRLKTDQDDIEADFVINCAGLFCDRVASMTGIKRTMRIVPFRGEYFQLSAAGEHLVKNLIYPVPDAQFPFLGVHFTRMIAGGIEAGPNAVLATAREGYKKTDFKLLDFVDAISFPGLWKFVRRYPSMVTEELVRSFSKKLFTASLQKLVPEVNESHLSPGGSGVRAQAMLTDGSLVQDFLITKNRKALHLLNAPSPAATASLAIARHVVQHLTE